LSNAFSKPRRANGEFRCHRLAYTIGAGRRSSPDEPMMSFDYVPGKINQRCVISRTRFGER